VGVKYTPIPPLSVSVTQRKAEGGRQDTVAVLSFTYPFDLSWSQLTRRTRSNNSATVEGFRYEFVKRENRMPLARRERRVNGPVGPGTPLNGLVVAFSGGEAFVEPGDPGYDPALGYQTVLSMTVKKYDNGVEDTSWDPSNVDWEVIESTINLSSDVWRNTAGPTAKTGLMWVKDLNDSVPGVSGTWNVNDIKVSSSQVSKPTGKTVFLADIVGSRTIKVTASADGEVPIEASFTFGDGPLSEFSGTRASNKKWARASSLIAFKALSGTTGDDFPAAVEVCGGTVNPDVTESGSYGVDNPGFNAADLWSGGSGDKVYMDDVSDYRTMRYALNSNLPKMEQLLAVSVYNDAYSGGVHRKGAAAAANWNLVGFTWSGEVLFNGIGFFAVDVHLGNGNADWYGMTTNNQVVCVR
jgi:hypothetical protein